MGVSLRFVLLAGMLPVAPAVTAADPSDDIFDLEKLRVKITEELPYVVTRHGSDEVLVIDSRSAEWTARGTIPGTVNIPYTRLDPGHTAAAEIAETLELDMGVIRADGVWNFSNAKTLVLFCNGAWCGQSPTNIKSLLNFGYPPHKLKWYRGGMQAREQLGLTTVKPDG
jgi:rhodanese-related sulfurtransferase